MGSRYGGLKQIDPVDEQGHIIMDFSIYDAMEAGFNKVVFVIRRNLEKDFKTLCRLEPDQKLTWQEAIDFLRAMTFQGYRNAYFYDKEGNKVFVEIRLEKD